MIIFGVLKFEEVRVLKDMKNNIEGVYTATKNNLQGNDIDGRLWLDDFDYLHNKWRRHRR